MLRRSYKGYGPAVARNRADRPRMADPIILHSNMRAGPAPARRPHEPLPGLGLKNLSNLPSMPLKLSASDGASFLRVMFGHWVE